MKDNTIETQKNEIFHKDEVNKGLVKDISLAEKRQILNKVKGAGKTYCKTLQRYLGNFSKNII